jgi:hypothetical protein
MGKLQTVIDEDGNRVKIYLLSDSERFALIQENRELHRRQRIFDEFKRNKTDTRPRTQSSAST